MAAGGAYAALPGGIAFAANAATGGALPLPTDVQRRWADMELGMFFHYDIPIFGGGNAPDPGRYNPEKLDTDQWMEAAKAYGAKYVVLTAKHGAGFMQWQSDIYPYGVKQSPWRGGKGDLVRDFVTSARKYGLKPGLYTAMHYNWFLGVRRSNGLVSHKGYYGIGPEAQKKYAASCEAALTELFTKYGELFEIWFDGGVRPPEEGGPRAREIIERLQPNAILFQGPKNARNVVRWVGNERGVAPYPCWAADSDTTLRSRKRGKEYDEESVSIRDELLAIARSPVKDGRLKGYFDLIVNRRDRFFQWVCNPEVEAENNLAERRLRPLVIARKVCFGSQSEKGLKTRETLMTIIDTLSLRCDDPVAKLSQVLDAIGRSKKTNVSELLWGPNTQPANVAKA